jgi:hypothetical protein
MRRTFESAANTFGDADLRFGRHALDRHLAIVKDLERAGRAVTTLVFPGMNASLRGRQVEESHNIIRKGDGADRQACAKP